jgi:hypothetical protein
MARSLYVQDERCLVKNGGAMTIPSHPCLHGISLSLYVDGKEPIYSG